MFKVFTTRYVSSMRQKALGAGLSGPAQVEDHPHKEQHYDLGHPTQMALVQQFLYNEHREQEYQENSVRKFTQVVSRELRKADYLCKQGLYSDAGTIYTKIHQVLQSSFLQYEKHLGDMLRVYSITGDKQALEQLVTENIEYFKKYQDPDTGNTALHTLLTHRMYDTAKTIATTENVRIKNNDGYTPVHIVFENENLSFIHDVLMPILGNSSKLPMDDVMSSIVNTSLYADDHFVELVGQLFDTSN